MFLFTSLLPLIMCEDFLPSMNLCKGSELKTRALLCQRSLEHFCVSGWKKKSLRRVNRNCCLFIEALEKIDLGQNKKAKTVTIKVKRDCRYEAKETNDV